MLLYEILSQLAADAIRLPLSRFLRNRNSRQSQVPGAQAVHDESCNKTTLDAFEIENKTSVRPRGCLDEHRPQLKRDPRDRAGGLKKNNKKNTIKALPMADHGRSKERSPHLLLCNHLKTHLHQPARGEARNCECVDPRRSTSSPGSHISIEIIRFWSWHTH